MPRDKARFLDYPLRSDPPAPCTHERCQFSAASELEYIERPRQLRASAGTAYLRVNGGPGHPFGAR